MEYRKLADSDLELSVITFGSWAVGSWMWGKTERNDAIGAIRTAYELGVTSIDTAPVYGQGDSEEIVGEAIRGIPRDKIQILTKFGMRWDVKKGTFAFKSKNNNGQDIDIYKYGGKESVIKECEDSLRRLKTDYIDLYQIHWPDPSTPVNETFEAVAKLIDQGKVRYAGVCNYDTPLLEEVKKTISIVSDQVPFSMVNREIQNEIVPYCIKHGKSILAYSPMQGGLLTGKMKPGYVFAEGDHRKNNKYFTDENIQRTNDFLERIKPLADEKGATLSQLIIRWTIEQPGITIALVGARNVRQAKQNAEAINVKLSHEEIEFINKQLETL
ncbi:aldo/keto reductase [uncultured Sanguibacteroides sp.]|uniref:aldo/keto reductase n=1 Tax=uncultured Sanguibacteroides sp. TaxID=1635151 RepID=UPI0025F72914|nr:aldo/keto reductase [uncultured Sanguibacteroides sp.]